MILWVFGVDDSVPTPYLATVGTKHAEFFKQLLDVAALPVGLVQLLAAVGQKVQV